MKKIIFVLFFALLFLHPAVSFANEDATILTEEETLLSPVRNGMQAPDVPRQGMDDFPFLTPEQTRADITAALRQTFPHIVLDTETLVLVSDEEITGGQAMTYIVSGIAETDVRLSTGDPLGQAAVAKGKKVTLQGTASRGSTPYQWKDLPLHGWVIGAERTIEINP